MYHVGELLCSSRRQKCHQFTTVLYYQTFSLTVAQLQHDLNNLVDMKTTPVNTVLEWRIGQTYRRFNQFPGPSLLQRNVTGTKLIQ